MTSEAERRRNKLILISQ